MENPLKAKFKTFLQKTGKLHLDFHRGGEGEGSSTGNRIPPEWSGLVAVTPGGRRGDEGVFQRDPNDASPGDDDVLSSMEAAYFTESGFDPTIFEIETLEVGAETTDLNLIMIDERRKALLRQLKVVTKKAYARILEKRPQCFDEMTKVTRLDDSLVNALEACASSRGSLESARCSLAASSLGMLAAAKRRQRTHKLLHNLTIIATLQKTDVRLHELLTEGDYPAAIQLLTEVQQAVKTYSHFIAIKQLSLKLQDTLELAEEQLDVALAKVASNFNSDQYKKIQDAYTLLGKTQTSMDQLQMHVTSAVHNTAWNVVYSHAMMANSAELDLSKRAYPDVCSMVGDATLIPCLVDLCQALWVLMRSYKQIVYWHEAESRDSTPSSNLDKHLERQYVQRKLVAGLSRMWQDVQTKVRILVVSKEVGTKMNINDFLHLMHVIHKLIEFGHEFCGSDSDTLQDSLKQECSTYFKRYHLQRIEDLKLHLENEAWAICPVKQSFKLTQLKEYYEVSQSFTDKGSPKKQARYFSTPRRESSTKPPEDISPFCPALDDSQNDGYEEDLFFQTDASVFYENDLDESDNDCENHELSKAEINEDEDATAANLNKSKKKSPVKPNFMKKSASDRMPILTNTSLMLLRLFGNYINLMQMLRPISGDIFTSMTQLLDYYVLVIHTIFSQESQGEALNYFGYGSTSPRFQNLLSKIRKELVLTSEIEGNTDSSPNFLLDIPQAPESLKSQLSDAESLNGLSEKFIAVESAIFASDQLRLIRKIIDQLAPDDKDLVDSYFSQTLPVIEDLRRPVYWSVSRNAFGFDSILQQINKVSWDIKEVKSQHSQYVDLLLRELQIFCIRLQDVSENKIPISSDAQKTLWDLVVLAASFLFVEGFSNAKKCSNEGRALMQLDFRQFVLKLEAISDLKPLPHQDLVANYVKAYYIQEMELEEWVKLHTEYSPKHLLSLINCVAYNNNKTKQKLNAIINELSTIKISLIK